MKKSYNFEEQKQLLEIALQICEDYNATEFSLGGGTLLSAAYYQHRMSYDIDIFSEDFSFIQNLIDNKATIAQSLNIDEHNIEASSSAITFILSTENAGLKLDFLYGEPITNNPYSSMDVLGQDNLKVQTPEEIIARKIKYREILTVRDFIDFSFVQQDCNMLKELQKQSIDNVDIERYIDIVDQISEMSNELLETELELLDTTFKLTHDSLIQSIKTIVEPDENIEIIYDDTYEVVSIDNFNKSYIEFAKEYDMNYYILVTTISKIKETITDEINYKTIFNLQEEKLKILIQ